MKAYIVSGIDVCSFKSQFAANGYIAFQEEVDRQDKERFPDMEFNSYKVEETLLHYEN